MNSRKQLIKDIEKTKTQVDSHRLKAFYHKKYFGNILNKSYFLMIAALFPIFLLGWKNGKLVKKTGRTIIPFVNFLMSLFFYSQKRRITRF